MINRMQWLLVLAVIAGTLVADYYMDWESDLYRILALTSGAAVALGIAALTAQGGAAIKLFSEARGELRKMFWPTRQETVQTTLLVMVVVAVLGLLLWGMDYVLAMGTEWLLG